MLRAVRFAAQLGFSIEEGTLAAIKRNAHRAENLSGERIKAELEKILLSPRPELAGEALKLGLLAHLGGSPDCPDLSPLRDVPAAPIPRWRAFCRLTGFPITALPVDAPSAGGCSTRRRRRCGSWRSPAGSWPPWGWRGRPSGPCSAAWRPTSWPTRRTTPGKSCWPL